MPMYDLHCKNCGDFQEDVHITIDAYEPRMACDECDAPESVMRVGWGKFVGPTDTHPMKLGQFGKEFNSKKKLDKFMNDNDKWTFAEKGSRSERKIRDSFREKAEKVARKAGYRDLEHRRKADKKRRRGSTD